MASNTYLTLQDVTSLILCISGVVVLVLLCVGMFYLIGTLRRIYGILKNNDRNLNDFAVMLPQTLKKVDTTVDGLVEMVEAVRPAVKNITGAIDETAATVSDINTKVLGKVVDLKWILEIISNVFTFVSDKFGKGTEKDGA